MSTTEQVIRECASPTSSRYVMWTHFLREMGVKRMAEIGIRKAKFAAHVLREVETFETYYMIDPWRHLDDWDKPANENAAVFDELMAEALSKTEFAADKRVVLRGTTAEVVDEIGDGELDFAYIDGDHTLRGITIDLVRVFPKIRAGGWIGGDDFTRTVWQHGSEFEPTLVFPFAVYFAESVGARIFALPNSQFLLEKRRAGSSFEFVDLTGGYGAVGLRTQFHPNKVIKQKLYDLFPFVRRLSTRKERRHRRAIEQAGE